MCIRDSFIRERVNKQYQVSSYFWAKSLSELPFQILWPWIQITITYFGVGLNSYFAYKYWIAVLSVILSYLSGGAYGIFLSIVFPKQEVAMSLMHILAVPLLAFAGFFVNQDKIPYYLYPFAYISPWKYGFQALMINEYTDNPGILCYSLTPPCDPLGEQHFQEGLWTSIFAQFAIGIFFRLLAMYFLYKYSTPPKRNFGIPKKTQEEVESQAKGLARNNDKSKGSIEIRLENGDSTDSHKLNSFPKRTSQ
eukprot:TRINITY_DN22767_c0_g1_i1.p1 TRINITY_DN22767_c0_g1~~TRINITY_DN22767_c0_g1_i1.p1  ORF type:complete len:251 (-),score=4.17 TRINITY_DN22767_c0_g1_i1:40-792(-)